MSNNKIISIFYFILITYINICILHIMEKKDISFSRKTTLLDNQSIILLHRNFVKVQNCGRKRRILAGKKR